MAKECLTPWFALVFALVHTLRAVSHHWLESGRDAQAELAWMAMGSRVAWVPPSHASSVMCRY
jgi:uncharacterized membrane protein YadS